MIYTFENSGHLLQRTNYFDSPAALNGQFYLSWNANCARLLVPDNQKHLLQEMKTGKRVEIEIITGGINLVFDDDTETPFVITLAKEQCDRVLTEKDQGADCLVSVYIRLGEKYQFAGRING